MFQQPAPQKKPLTEDVTKPPAGGGSVQPQQPQTFSQMQKQGQARPPAPPPPRPNVLPAQQGGTPMQPLPPAQHHGLTGVDSRFDPATQMPVLQGGGQAGQPPAPGISYPPQPGQPGHANLEQQLMGNWQNFHPNAGFQSSQPNSQLNQQTQQSLLQGLINPSAYNSDVVQGTYNQLNQGLSQGFDIQRQKLAEEMSRRGLDASSIHGGRYSDLGVEQARAQTGLAQSLLDRQAQTYGSDRASAQGQAMSYGGQQFGQDLQGYNANLDNNQQNFSQRQQALQQLLGYGQQSFDNQMDVADFNNNQDFQNMQLYLQMMGQT